MFSLKDLNYALNERAAGSHTGHSAIVAREYGSLIVCGVPGPCPLDGAQALAATKEWTDRLEQNAYDVGEAKRPEDAEDFLSLALEAYCAAIAIDHAYTLCDDAGADDLHQPMKLMALAWDTYMGVLRTHQATIWPLAHQFFLKRHHTNFVGDFATRVPWFLTEALPE